MTIVQTLILANVGVLARVLLFCDQMARNTYMDAIRSPPPLPPPHHHHHHPPPIAKFVRRRAREESTFVLALPLALCPFREIIESNRRDDWEHKNTFGI
ncbi:hypothetical protein M0802_003710 [Mischocyttarus mexicanus]|nr:hypothetical protein M0802_003710 [Mischocyttarus mexicanus]